MADLVITFFTVCVQLMHTLADWSGLSYKEVNALIFLVLQPFFILFFATLWILELRKSRSLKQKF